MPVTIPVTAAGSRRVRVAIGPKFFEFHTYYVSGQSRHWLLDIHDDSGNPLIVGINLVPGVDNLLKGRGNVLRGHQLHVLAKKGTETNPEALGNTMTLLWFLPGEENPFTPGDPMDAIGENLWA